MMIVVVFNFKTFCFPFQLISASELKAVFCFVLIQYGHNVLFNTGNVILLRNLVTVASDHAFNNTPRLEMCPFFMSSEFAFASFIGISRLSIFTYLIPFRVVYLFLFTF